MFPYVSEARDIDTFLFIKRRALRILPPYYLALGFSLLMIATLVGVKTGTRWDASIPVTPSDIIFHVLLLQDWIGSTGNKIDPPLWSVGVEWKIYFLFPMLLWCARRWGFARTVSVSVIISYLIWFLLWWRNLLNPTPWGSSPYYVGLFAMGMLVAKIGEDSYGMQLARSRYYRVLLIIASLFVVATVLRQAVPQEMPLQMTSLFVGALSAMILLTLRIGLMPKWCARTLSSRWLAGLGAIAYSVYLIHAPIIQAVYIYLVRPMNLAANVEAPLYLILAGAVAIAVSCGFYVACERPFHRLAQRASRRARWVGG
jgi:peptidoglycan/LPS O-acetylase OafA/YrhL